MGVGLAWRRQRGLEQLMRVCHWVDWSKGAMAGQHIARKIFREFHGVHARVKEGQRVHPGHAMWTQTRGRCRRRRERGAVAGQLIRGRGQGRASEGWALDILHILERVGITDGTTIKLDSWGCGGLEARGCHTDRLEWVNGLIRVMIPELLWLLVVWWLWWWVEVRLHIWEIVESGNGVVEGGVGGWGQVEIPFLGRTLTLACGCRQALAGHKAHRRMGEGRGGQWAVAERCAVIWPGVGCLSQYLLSRVHG